VSAARVEVDEVDRFWRRVLMKRRLSCETHKTRLAFCVGVAARTSNCHLFEMLPT